MGKLRHDKLREFDGAKLKSGKLVDFDEMEWLSITKYWQMLMEQG